MSVHPREFRSVEAGSDLNPVTEVVPPEKTGGIAFIRNLFKQEQAIIKQKEDDKKMLEIRNASDSKIYAIDLERNYTTGGKPYNFSGAHTGEHIKWFLDISGRQY